MRNAILLLAASCAQLALAAPQSYSFDDAASLARRQASDSRPVCPKRGVHIIAGSGAGAPQYNGYGLLLSTVNAIKFAVPGSDNYSVPYTKTPNPALIDGAVAQGVDLMTSNIQWFANGCPNTPIVLLGYSQGGMVESDTLCGRSRFDGQPYGPPLNSSLAPNIIAAIVYGDETRTPGQTWDLGTCTDGSGYFARSNNAGCATFAPVYRSYCDYNDPNCCSGGNAPDQQIHYTYPGKYDSQVASYVKSQYQAYLKTHRKGIFGGIGGIFG